MRKGFKILILTAILLTPAGIYIFLQSFGHNEFDIPVYMDKNSKEGKVFVFDRLYDINGTKVDFNTYTGEIIVLEFISSLSDHTEQDYQIKRISDIFRNETSVRIIRVFVSDNLKGSIPTKVVGQSEKNISVLYTDHDEMSEMIHSVMPPGENNESSAEFNKVLLLDNEHKIRGSYIIDDFEEIDRLILEIKILLKIEQHA